MPGTWTPGPGPTPGDDTYFGDGGVDVVDGGAGNDFIVAYEGDDTLYGGAGDDELVTGPGNDTAYGGIGNDRFVRIVDHDQLYGEDGNDTFELQVGTPFTGSIDGGSGVDRLLLSGGTLDTTAITTVEELVLRGGLSNNTTQVHAGVFASFTTFLANGRVQLLEAGVVDLTGIYMPGSYWDGPFITNFVPQAYFGFTGSAGNDTFIPAVDTGVIIDAHGYDGNDYLRGGPQGDTLNGNLGNDTIEGRGGNDTLVWDVAGVDTLDGGAGDDAIRFDIFDITTATGVATIIGGDGLDTLFLIRGGMAAGSTVTGVEQFTFAPSSYSNSSEVFLPAGFIPAGSTVAYYRASITLVTSGVIDLTSVTFATSFTYQGATYTPLELGFTGSAGDDTFVFPENGPAFLHAAVSGGGGNDHVLATNLNDYLDGGAGNDTLVARGGDNILIGGAGDDALQAGDGADDISGDAGADTIDAGGGANIVEGGDGNDTVDAGSGDDFVTGNGNNDTIRGGAGNDLLFGERGYRPDLPFFEEWDRSRGSDRLEGGDGDDLLIGGLGDDVLIGGGGDDRLVANIASAATASGALMFGEDEAANDALDGGGGFDRAWLDYSASILGIRITLSNVDAVTPVFFGGRAGGSVAGIEQFEIDGTQLSDVIDLSGAGGDHVISGRNGNDTLTGGAGADQLDAGPGDDTVNGGAGDDIISPGDGNDVLGGGEGFDTLSLYGYGFAVTIDLAARTMAIAYQPTHDTFQGFENVIGTSSGDTIYGDDGANIVDAKQGNDIVYGRSGADVIEGFSGNDTLYGYAPTGGDDDAGNTLSGGDGNDALYGAGGNDTLNGGAGVDRMDGGAGDDAIFYTQEDDFANIAGGTGTDTLICVNRTPTTFGLAAHGFERAEVRLSDDFGENPWTTQLNLYDVNWQLDSSRVVNDDGSRIDLDYDAASAFFWTSKWSNYNPAGQLEVEVLVHDDGVRDTLGYDPADTHDWTTAWVRYDNLDRVDTEAIGYDNGTQLTLDHDQANAFDWTQDWLMYDSLDRVELEVITYDDGSRAVLDLDASDAFDWASMWWLFDENGNQVAFHGVNDDGTTF